MLSVIRSRKGIIQWIKKHLKMIFDCEDEVNNQIEYKINRLNRRLKGEE